MTFFYDLNKRLASLASKQDAEQLAEHSVPATQPKSQLAQALNERDLGKHNNATTGFKALAKKAGGGNIEKGNRIAGAQLAKMRAKGQVEESDMEESAFQAAIGKKKFGDQGMKALQKAGREHASDKTMDNIRNRYDKYDESQGIADEGNAFTGALAKTPKGGKFKVGSKEFTDTSDLEEGFKEMDAWLASREKEKGTGRFDKKKISTGTVYTRKPETFDDPETDPEATGGAPKKKGRPKGKDKGPERVTAKSYKYKAGRPTKTQEDLDSDGVLMTRPSNMSSEAIEPGDRDEYDQEGESAKHDIKTIVRHAQALHKILGDDDNLPEWVQSKLAKIEGMMIAVDEYMQNQDQSVAEMDSQGYTGTRDDYEKDRKYKGPVGTGKSVAPKKVVKDLSKDFEKSFTKEKKVKKESSKPDFLDLDKDGNKTEPMKKAAKDKKEEKVDETTVAGSVATAPAAAKKSAGGYNFGGGVYEGMNRRVENAIMEGMNVSINMNSGADGNPTKSITVSAEGEDAEALAQLLKMAGLGGNAETCPTCGKADCGCQSIDENSPDWPTNTETSDDALQYSGGLNKPKSTGQTTVPVVASQLRRQVSMEEGVTLERSLFKLYQNYKAQ